MKISYDDGDTPHKAMDVIQLPLTSQNKKAGRGGMLIPSRS
jgi:hypothetical protein